VPLGIRILVDCVQQYCYCREKKYYPFDNPHDLTFRIDVKENAPELLRQVLSHVPGRSVDASTQSRFLQVLAITNRAVKAKGSCPL
jgi:DNA repair photolyase